MTYKHTQTGHLMIITLLAVILLFGTILTQSPPELPIISIMFVVILILLSFTSLNVMIDEEYLRIKFGYGIFKKRFMLKEITSVRTVTNRWFYGWGIRLWFWPKMWIFNVSGFDAVEIKMKDGKRYRIGTDEAEKLEDAIMQVIK